MSDFESRLGDALSSAADRAPDATGLAEGARRRSRRRRTAVAGAVAAVVVAVAVPVGVVALNIGGSDPVDGGGADDPAVAPVDTRTETWHGVSVEVPATWGYGSRTAWCAGGDAEEPVVERPGGVVEMIACSPTFSWGVSFEPKTADDPGVENGRVWHSTAADGADFPGGTWHGFWYDGDAVVQVAARYQEEVQAIIDSAHRVDSVDANGCPVERAEGFASEEEQLSVCRYDADGQLEQSERLSAADTAEAIAALSAAPAGDPEMPASCAEDQPARLVVDLISASVNSEVILQAPCPYSPGITSGGESFQELTADVLYWALSPGWSGSLRGEAPLPDPLRTLATAEPTDAPVAESPCPDGYYANSDFGLDPDNGEPMTVCRMEMTYGAESGGTLLLADTVQLSQSDSDAVRAAVEAAPVLEESDFRQCNTGPAEFFLVLTGDAVPLWVYNGRCGELAALTAGEGGPTYHAVTDELLDALGSPHGLLR